MTSISIVCAGFLLGVLWMDLLFDVQVLRHRRRPGDLPDEVLASIAAYYARVTTDARPLGHLIAAVMLLAVATLTVELVRGQDPLWVRLASLLLVGAPIALAVMRVVPDAVRLGTRVDSPARQSALARSICRDHLLCFASLVAFLLLRAGAAWGRGVASTP